MIIAIGSDHAGFEFKEEIKKYLEAKGHKLIDVGTYSKDSCDYPDFGHAVGYKVSTKEAELPEEVYDEEYHTLKIPRKNQEFFITEKKKYGPYYVIFNAIYQDDEHFQFTFMKAIKIS